MESLIKILLSSAAHQEFAHSIQGQRVYSSDSKIEFGPTGWDYNSMIIGISTSSGMIIKLRRTMRSPSTGVKTREANIRTKTKTRGMAAANTAIPPSGVVLMCRPVHEG